MSSPHGSVVMTLALKQDGAKVTGTLTSDHTGELTMRGEFADGKLKLETVEGNAQITLEGTLKDGALAGYMSTEMGDMNWTATRARDK